MEKLALQLFPFITSVTVSVSQVTTSNTDTCTNTCIAQQELISFQRSLIQELSDRITLESIIDNQQELISFQRSLLQELSDRIGALENSAGTGNGQEQDIGTTYVRWGRTTCPDTAELVYDGYAGKAYYSHGGGVDYQCLPRDPEWPSGATSGFQSLAYMYGVENEHASSPVWPSNVHDNDAPCALCSVSGRTRQAMIPAKQTCPNGWIKEYSGFLVSERHTHKGSTFACLDSEVELLVGGSSNVNGGLFYIVEARCGSLKCSPYVDGYELSCVVCTK